LAGRRTAGIPEWHLAEPIEVTLSVSAVLERLGVEYLVVGSLASSLHGIPRATLDVDIVADLRMPHVKPLVAALENEFFIDADMVTEAVRRRATFNLLHLATMFKVDVFVVGDPASHSVSEIFDRCEEVA
jgi:hypothetical protein